MSTSQTVHTSLHGRRAVVTGGTVGIGRATAVELGHRGAEVIIVGRDQARAEDTVAALQGIGAKASYVLTDLADDDAVDRIYEYAGGDGQVDILVNAAAIRSKVPALQVDARLWQHVMTVNLTQPFFLSTRFAAGMVEHGWGKIVNVTSILESRAAPARSPYAVSKAGVSAFTRAIALELALANVQVNAIAPGLVATPALEPQNDAERARMDASIARIPIGRVAQPQDIASLIGFLCSDESSYITGQIYYIDGGMTLL